MLTKNFWTTEEDLILKQIIQSNRSKKWCTIAKIMKNQFKIQGRTGKQCRQRWYNKLNPVINTQQWTISQQQKLFQLHNALGNKWSKISSYIPGRTDNSIKNHFYSTLRKAFRGINRYILRKKKKEIIPFKNSLLNKIIIMAEMQFYSNNTTKQQNQTYPKLTGVIDLKNRLIEYKKRIQKGEEVDGQSQQLIIKLVQINELILCQNFQNRKKIKMSSQCDIQVSQVVSNHQNQVPLIKIQDKIQIKNIENLQISTFKQSIKTQFQVNQPVPLPIVNYHYLNSFPMINFPNIFYEFHKNANLFATMNQFTLSNDVKCKCCEECKFHRLQQQNILFNQLKMKYYPKNNPQQKTVNL